MPELDGRSARARDARAAAVAGVRNATRTLGADLATFPDETVSLH